MEGFVGEIRLFAGGFAPSGWALCNGQALIINGDTQPLYSLIGNTYGSPSHETFCVPDLQGRIPVGVGQAPQLTYYPVGAIGGQSDVELHMSHLPTHTHIIYASDTIASSKQPDPSLYLAATSKNVRLYNDVQPSDTSSTPFSPSAISPTGLSVSHSNKMPTLAINYIICLRGHNPYFS